MIGLPKNSDLTLIFSFLTPNILVCKTARIFYLHNFRTEIMIKKINCTLNSETETKFNMFFVTIFNAAANFRQLSSLIDRSKIIIKKNILLNLILNVIFEKCKFW